MSTSLAGSRGPTGGLSGGNVIPKGYRHGQLQQYTPEQMQLFQSMFSQVQPGSYLSRLAAGDEGIFNQIEAPAMSQFQGLLGQTNARFGTGGVGHGFGRSSGFQNTLGQQSMDFAQQLASQRQGLQQRAIKDLMGMSGELLGQKPYEQFLAPKQKSFWKELLLGSAPGIAQGAAMLPFLL